MKVFVYYNLHKSCWSVKALNGPNKGRVVARVPAITVYDAIFKVSEAGRQRVIKEKRKNVHAGVVGFLTGSADFSLTTDKRVTYNPYKGPDFTLVETGEPIKESKVVMLNDKRQVFAN